MPGAARHGYQEPFPHPSGARPPQLPDPTIPAHVAVVMDGNGRWANQQGLPRTAGHEAGEAELGPWGAEVVADSALVVEELSRHDRADRVAAEIVGPGPAAAVPEEPGQRLGPALLQRPAQHVALVHRGSIAAGRRRRRPACEQWRRWESNPRPRSCGNSFYERSRPSVLVPR